MSDGDDTESVPHHLVSEEDADRLLSGRALTAPDRSLDPLAGFLSALREPARPAELEDTDEFVAHLADVVRRTRVVPLSAASGRRRRAGRLVTGKVAIVTAAVLLSAGAAAAATGTLPDPIQRGVSSTFLKVGIDLPHPDEPATGSDEPGDAPTSTEDKPTAGSTGSTVGSDGSTGPDASGPAAAGLCTAFRADGAQGTDSVAFAKLTAAAAALGKTVDEFCGTAPTPTDTTDGRGGSGTSGPPRRPADTAPGNGGTTPGDTAPGKGDKVPGEKVPGDKVPGDTAPGSDGGRPDETAPGRGGSAGGTPNDTAPGRGTDKTTPSATRKASGSAASSTTTSTP